MRVARALRRELDLWMVVWQQVETFLERIDGARDADDPHRRKLEALLRAAGVVERHWPGAAAGSSLSPPVVDQMPTQYWDPVSGTTKPVSSLSAEGAWSLDLRKWRIPGSDEVELAAGNLLVSEADGELKLHEAVSLPPGRAIFSRPSGDGGELELLVLPSYPAAGGSIVATIPPGTGVSIGGDGDADALSLFSLKRRKDAATGAVGEDEDPVLRWSQLCAARRGARDGTDVPWTGQAAGPPPPSAASLAHEAIAVVAGLRAGTLPALAAAPALERIAADARAAAGAGSPDADTLREAAEVLDAEGCRTLDLPDQLRLGADHLAGNPAALLALADAADALRAAPSSGQARTGLEGAAAALTATPPPLLLSLPVEAGPLRLDLDEATAARITYPDGTLRILRALESGFAAAWGSWLRWLKARHTSLLQPLVARFTAPFYQGVRALVEGGDTGLVCEGLEIAGGVPVGADTVVTAQPASLRAALDDIEPGQIGVVLGERPAALVVLGLDERGGRLALNVSPLRVSTAAGPPGSAGVLGGDQPIRCDAPGLSTEALRSGEADEGPAADGLVHETVALWSRLCLVFGSDAVEQGIHGAASAGRTVPDPSGAPLEALALHGKVPAHATCLVITGAGAAYWDSDGDEPEPRIARPGEILLLRGRAEAEGDQADGGMVQAPVEVEQVFRTTGSMLERMDLSTAGRLSTTPLELDAEATPILGCGPDEDAIVVILRRSWMDRTLVADVTLRRDFAGFDLPSLATQRLLPPDLLEQVLPAPPPVPAGAAGVDRGLEFAAALEMFRGWTRYATNG